MLTVRSAAQQMGRKWEAGGNFLGSKWEVSEKQVGSFCAVLGSKPPIKNACKKHNSLFINKLHKITFHTKKLLRKT